MKLKSTPGAMDNAKLSSAVNYGPDAPSLDADMGQEDIDPLTGRDMDDIPPGSFELLTPTINNIKITHEGDMGRLSPLE